MTEQLPILATQGTVAPGGTLPTTGSFPAQMQILGDDVLLTVKEVAFLIGVSPRQIYTMIHRKTFPGPRKLGALSRWRLGLVKSWLHDDGIRRA